MQEKKVRDIMNRGVVTVRYDETLPNIAGTMAEENISCIVIVNEDDETAGIITSFDIMKAFGEKTEEEIERTTAEDIMTPLVYNVSPEMTLKEVSNIMLVKNIHRVVVLSAEGKRKPVVLLSAADIVKEIKMKEEEMKEVTFYENLDGKCGVISAIIGDQGGQAGDMQCSGEPGGGLFTGVWQPKHRHRSIEKKPILFLSGKHGILYICCGLQSASTPELEYPDAEGKEGELSENALIRLL
jgi:CBS domain-containing protein